MFPLTCNSYKTILKQVSLGHKDPEFVRVPTTRTPGVSVFRSNSCIVHFCAIPFEVTFVPRQLESLQLALD